MKELIYFNTKYPLDKDLFESFLSENFKIDTFIWINENVYEFTFNNELDIKKTYISLVTSSEGFKYHYSVFCKYELEISLKVQIQILITLSEKFKKNILSTDDEINPWSWVLIEPNGQTSTIQTKTPDELEFEEFYNFPFGDFRTTHKISPTQQNQLKSIINHLYENVEIEFSNDGPIINVDFNRVKNTFEKLKYFENHYSIIPIGKNKWFSIEDKSNQFISIMEQYQELTNLQLCIFPRNFSETKNIEGGSDSEQHCILITNSGKEKITYKKRRKSWLS